MEFIEFTEDEVKIWGWDLEGWDRRRYGAEGRRKKRRKKKYSGNFGIIRNFEGGRVPSYNL